MKWLTDEQREEIARLVYANQSTKTAEYVTSIVQAAVAAERERCSKECEHRAALARQEKCEDNSPQYWAREGAYRAYMTDARLLAEALRRGPASGGPGHDE